MKRFLILLTLIVSMTTLKGQVGFNNPTPDPSSLLDLSANDKGLLVPRMTSAQRAAISSPGQSLLVFDTNKQGFYFYTGGNWFALNEWVKNASSNDVSLTGNASVTGNISSGSISNAGGLTTASLSVSGFSTNALVPSGAIIMWSGSIASIPSGWALCNGGSGTPDLRDRFIVGAGSAYSPGNIGGEPFVTLGVNEMPSHTHGVSDPGHNHNNGNYGRLLRLQPPSGNTTVASVDFSPAEPDITTSQLMLNSSTGISINSTGSSGAHENRPPYYALAYIMKL